LSRKVSFKRILEGTLSFIGTLKISLWNKMSRGIASMTKLIRGDASMTKEDRDTASWTKQDR